MTAVACEEQLPIGRRPVCHLGAEGRAWSNLFQEPIHSTRAAAWKQVHPVPTAFPQVKLMRQRAYSEAYLIVSGSLSVLALRLCVALPCLSLQ